MHSPVKRSNGQATTETIVLLPVYLLMVFGLLQMGQLGTALVIANYAASAIARQVVQDGGTGNNGGYQNRFRGLLTAGMKHAEIKLDKTPGLMSDVTVHACAEIDAFPFVGPLLGVPIQQGLPRGRAKDCGDALSAFSFNTAPYIFTVHGKAKARMNYRPNG